MRNAAACSERANPGCAAGLESSPVLGSEQPRRGSPGVACGPELTASSWTAVRTHGAGEQCLHALLRRICRQLVFHGPTTRRHPRRDEHLLPGGENRRFGNSSDSAPLVRPNMFRVANGLRPAIGDPRAGPPAALPRGLLRAWIPELFPATEPHQGFLKRPIGIEFVRCGI